MTRKPRIFVPKAPARCCGKNRYASKTEAQRVAEEQMLLREGLKLDVYACLCGCGGWHLTRALHREDGIFTA